MSSCQRCAKSGRECTYTVPEKRRRRKRTDTRVAELEHTVQVLAAKLEYEQRARLEQSEHLRRHSDSQRAIVLDLSRSQAPDVLGQSLSGHESLRQDLAQHTSSLAALKSRGLSIASSSSTYTPSSPGDFSTSERATDVLSIPDASPSPSSTLASSDVPSSNRIDYRSSSINNQQSVNWPTSNPFHGLSPQHASGNNDFYNPGGSYSQNSPLAFPLPPQPRSWAVPSGPFPNSATENDFAPANTGAYPSRNLSDTSAPLQTQNTWCAEPSNGYPTYQDDFQNTTHHTQVQPQQPWS
ncbi:MAG: hypothetical protein Q9225_003572 [Loekoesia sp. 1 TL-2023]